MSSGASGEIHAHHDRSYSSYPCVDRWHFYSGNAEAAESGGRDLSDLRGRDWTRAAEIASHLAWSRSVYASMLGHGVFLTTRRHFRSPFKGVKSEPDPASQRASGIARW